MLLSCPAAVSYRAAVVLALLLTGCSATAADRDDNVSAPAPSLSGMSAHQAEVSQRVATGGEVGFADYETAVNDYVACLEEGGVVVNYREPVVRQGKAMIELGYAYPDPEDMTEAQVMSVYDEITLSCRAYALDTVEYLWYSDGTTVEWLDAKYLEYEDAILRCLERHGQDVTGLTEREDIEDAVGELVESSDNYSGPNCMDESGLSDAVSEG